MRKFILLIVDDNEFFIERITRLLDEIENIEKIEKAHNYNEAISFLSNDEVDIVLLDINLPGKNGIELLKEIRKSGKKCLIIMISNHDNEYYRDQCKKSGADFFLDKSGDFAMLPSIINDYKLI